MVGCDCAVCRSPEPNNRRFRSSVLLEEGGRSLLVDAGTDFRSQALRHGLSRLDAVVLTHAHADHVLGLDDLRPLSWQKEIPIGVDEQTQGHVKRMFPYFFTETRSKSSRPQVTLTRLTPGEVITMAGFTLLPVSVWHGDDKILGFRTGDFAYLTDCNGIPDETWELLAGLEVLVLGVLRYKPHATHFHLEPALEAIRRVGAKRTVLTHLSHEFDHFSLADELPEGVEPGYDGMVIDL